MRRLGTLAVGALLLAAPAGAAEPAMALFGARARPAEMPTAIHGSYAGGCIAGAVPLPETGPGWQAMRLGRNRNWGHPALVAYIERLAARAQAIGWPGLLVGDMSQPRGGPMPSGHRSHQIGLDADIWLRPADGRVLSVAEREEVGSPSVVAADRRSLTEDWTPLHARLLEIAARDPAVERIFVNAAIKARLCRTAPQGDRAWLAKLRPWWGHDEHFHVRLACPPGAADCVDQQPVPPGDGCDATLAWWFTDEALNPAPGGKARELTLADLPPACAAVLSR